MRAHFTVKYDSLTPQKNSVLFSFSIIIVFPFLLQNAQRRTLSGEFSFDLLNVQLYTFESIV